MRNFKFILKGTITWNGTASRKLHQFFWVYILFPDFPYILLTLKKLNTYCEPTCSWHVHTERVTAVAKDILIKSSNRNQARLSCGHEYWECAATSLFWAEILVAFLIRRCVIFCWGPWTQSCFCCFQVQEFTIGIHSVGQKESLYSELV